ncbi:MAG: polyprenyl synthetase family protein [Hyphomicrobiales bacterium]|nr:polyprenyl synthetase family protein [Hyphomicrobiales bacterium]
MSDKIINIDKLIAITSQDMSRVNNLIIERTLSNTEMIPKISQYLISSGGKRLRPMLTIAASQLCECKNDHYLSLAASVEFMHTATLLHDDVVDDSSMRRGKLSARMLWGNEASVLVGDYLLGEAFKMMVDAKSLKALEVLSNAAAIIAEGEVMQLVYSNNITISQEQYFRIINHKTAKLFSAAAEVGAIISNTSLDIANALRDFGLYLGIAFQLTDDALDYSSTKDKLGKDIGDDFYEGKITFPVIVSYKKSTDSEKEIWNYLLTKEEKNQDDFYDALKLIQNKNGLETTLEEARIYGQKAINSLEIFPKSEIKDALIEGVYFSYNRKN